MLAFVALAAAVSGPAPLGGLEGCWNVPGQVRGKPVTSIARGEWHLGRRYFMLHLRSLDRKDPYEAALVYGDAEKPDALNAYWMDSLGAAYSTSGKGSVTSDGFTIVYSYPDSAYTNRFQRVAKRWRWTIVEQVAGQPDKVFARYELTPASCKGMKFDF